MGGGRGSTKTGRPRTGGGRLHTGRPENKTKLVFENQKLDRNFWIIQKVWFFCSETKKLVGGCSSIQILQHAPPPIFVDVLAKNDFLSPLFGRGGRHPPPSRLQYILRFGCFYARYNPDVFGWGVSPPRPKKGGDKKSVFARTSLMDDPLL